MSQNPTVLSRSHQQPSGLATQTRENGENQPNDLRDIKLSSMTFVVIAINVLTEVFHILYDARHMPFLSMVEETPNMKSPQKEIGHMLGNFTTNTILLGCVISVFAIGLLSYVIVWMFKEEAAKQAWRNHLSNLDYNNHNVTQHRIIY